MPVTSDHKAEEDTGPIRRIPAEPRSRHAVAPTGRPATARRPPVRRPAKPPETGHGHGHGHTPAPPASRRVRLILIWLLVPVAVLTVAGMVWFYPWGKAKPTCRAPER